MSVRRIISIFTIALALNLSLSGQSTKPTEQDRASIERWTQLTKSGKQQQVIDETSAALNSNISPDQKAEILFVRALAGISGHLPGANSFVESFIQSAPHDERGGELLFRFARAETDPSHQKELYGQAVRQFPGTYWATMSQGAIRQIEGMGKPFILDFTDAITGKPVSIQKDFKGKIVVINFWASWCSDCAAELPQMLSLYANYKDQGVEFVGVSLDEPESLGGLTKMKDYVKAKRIPWPQFYQGDKFNSQFSSDWGVSATPTVFVVDRHGNLYSTTADGKIDEILSAMLSPAAN